METAAAVKRGGSRPGSGRKSTAIEEGAADAHILYAKARAKDMAFRAQQAELDFKISSGQFISRAEVRQSCAQAFSAIAQTIRSLPDNIERRLGISPELAEEIQILLDEALNALADDLERMTVKP